MSERTDDIGADELALMVKRLDRQRRARLAAEAISESATRALYDKQHHLMLLQAVAVAANESSSFDDALQTAVDQLCTNMHWPVGHSYAPVGAGALLSLSDIWFIDDLNRFERLRSTLEATQFPEELSLAGRAAAQQRPVWVNDLTGAFGDEVVAAARVAGLTAAVAIPIVAGGELAAVLELFSESAIEPDTSLVEIVTKIGHLLGQRYERARAEVTLRNSDEQQRLLFDANPNPMWVYDADTLAFLAVNDAMVAFYGWTREELLRMSIADIRSPDEAPALTATIDSGNEQRRWQHRKRNGSLVNVELTARELKLPGRRARLVMAVDVTDVRRTAEALRESERRFRDLLDNVQLVAVLLDVVGIITYCNPYLLALTGYSKQEVVGRNWFELFMPEDERASIARGYHVKMADGLIASHDENDIVTRRGDRRLIVWNNTVLRSPQGSVLGTASMGIDVTEQRRAERQLLHDAFHDALTGLPNRALFLDRASHALVRARRDPTQAFAVLLLDIDRFKVVNDSLGHAAGDALLVALARRLELCLRAGDTVARFGGDEFTIMIENIADVTEATRAASRIQDALAAPFLLAGEEVFNSASIGITLAGPEYDTPEQMLRDADTAMYRAKSQGKARYEIFDSRMRSEAVALLQLESDLRRAIERDELRVHYQPIVSLPGGAIFGFEALMRWQHPTRGLVSPADFIPLAEDTGLIVRMGEWILREACRQAAEWQRSRGQALSMSVNISSRQFSQTDLVREVERALADHPIEARNLTLEITESVILQNADTALETIARLRRLGVTIAIDDFGTGYSSLSYLHRLPIDKLKIDSSFVRNFGDDRRTVEIVRTIIDLGRNLGMDVIAEGIETAEQRDRLAEMRCGYGQGFLFSRPVDADAAGRLFARS